MLAINYQVNYKNISEVHVFSFLKNKELSDVWIHTIKRDNFSPNKLSKTSHFWILKKVNLIETSMSKSVSCLCNSKHIETNVSIKKQLNSIENLGVKIIQCLCN